MIYSCLSYPGAKRKVIGELLELFPDGIEDWREPFLGGGSVSIGFLQSEKAKDCKKFIVGDLYSEIWAFWVGIQRDPARVESHMKEYFYSFCPTHDTVAAMEPGDEDYQALYDLAIEEGRKFWDWTQKDDTIKGMDLYQRAARFFLVNRVSFSSLSDSGSLSKNRFIQFNPRMFDRAYEVSKVIQRLEILNAPFQETMAGVTDKSFVFLDPPYIAQEGSSLYGKKGSTHKGFPHQELADLCKQLPCKWLMTLDDSIKARKLYDGCTIERFFIQYTMALKSAEDALAGEELLIGNYQIYDRDLEDEFGLI
jgi:DNA adenine methylase